MTFATDSAIARIRTTTYAACCDHETGTCAEDVLCTTCDSRTGQPECFPSRTCEDVINSGDCGRHRGACCNAALPGGGCVDDVLPEDCVNVLPADQLTWFKNETCAAVEARGDCTEHIGACCNTLDGTCTNDVLPEDCQGDQREWMKGLLCVDVDCTSHLGACCDNDTFGGCTETTYADCRCKMCKWNKLRPCAQVECPHPPIPTVSEWGLVVLTLLLLSGAKIAFKERSRVAKGSC
jgi:IPTL-CTERM motif